MPTKDEYDDQEGGGESEEEKEKIKKTREVIELAIFSHTDAEIATITGMKPGEIRRLRTNAELTLTGSYMKGLEHNKQVELRKLDIVEREAYESMQFSKRGQVTIEESEEDDGVRAKTRKTTRTKYTPAEAEFMACILRCIDMRCKILGLYAAKKVDITVEYQHWVVNQLAPVLETFCENNKLDASQVRVLAMEMEKALQQGNTGAKKPRGITE